VPLSSKLSKNSRSSEREFFIQADRLGISSRVSVYIINSGLPLLYLITPFGVHFCRLDDIQCYALIYYRFYAIIHSRGELYEKI